MACSFVLALQQRFLLLSNLPLPLTCPHSQPSLLLPFPPFISLFNWTVPTITGIVVTVCIAAHVVLFFIPLRYILLVWGEGSTRDKKHAVSTRLFFPFKEGH